MITDSPYFDAGNDWSFPLTDVMFVKPLREKCSKARLYLVNFLSTKVIVNNARINEMKREAFERMMKELNSKIFGVIYK
jgi:hypothetical protein